MKSILLFTALLILTGCAHKCRPIAISQANAPSLIGTVHGGSGACYTAADLTSAFKLCAAKEKICRLNYVQ